VVVEDETALADERTCSSSYAVCRGSWFCAFGNPFVVLLVPERVSMESPSAFPLIGTYAFISELGSGSVVDSFRNEVIVRSKLGF